MKKTKISLILMSVSMTILALTGCGIPSSTKAPMNNTKSTNQTNKYKQSMSTATMTTLYSNTLKELVVDKTITNTQSKKVLAVITRNMSQASVTNNSNEATSKPGTTGAKGTTETPGSTGSTGSTETAGTAGTTGTGTTNSTNKLETSKIGRAHV